MSHKKDSKRKINEKYAIKGGFKIKRSSLISIIIFTIVFASLSGAYLTFEWNKYKNIAESEAIQLSQSVVAFLYPESLQKLSGTVKDLDNPAYIGSKLGLERFINQTNNIKFAYSLIERDGKIVFVLDSEPPDSVDASPPGQVFEEADAWIWKAFKTEETLITPPTPDRWGTWITVLTPINDPITGEMFSVLGMDYYASEWTSSLWKQMIPDITVVFGMLLLTLAFIVIRFQQSSLKKLNKKLAKEEAFYRGVFEQAPLGIAILTDKNFTDKSRFSNMNMNSMFEKILGRTRAELELIKWPEITYPDDLEEDLEKFEQFKTGQINGYTMEKRFVKKDGSIVWTMMQISSLVGLDNKNSSHLCLIEDISDEKMKAEELKEVKRREASIVSHLPGLTYRSKCDRKGTLLFVSDGAFELTGYPSKSLINNKDIAANDLILPEHRERYFSELRKAITTKSSYKIEYEMRTAKGATKWVLDIGQGIYNKEGQAEALEGMLLDISDRKEVENRIIFMNAHDELTGLLNRSFLESILERDSKNSGGVNRALVSINLKTVQLLTSNYGFKYTQRVLKKVAEELNSFSTDKCTLFRTFENRFVFYLRGYKSRDELLEFGKTIAEMLELVLITDRISGGIGILELQNDKEFDTDLVLRKLLIASEQNKDSSGKEFEVCIYDKDLENIANRAKLLRQELSRIANDENSVELFLQYQPIYDLRTESVSGFEALARLKIDAMGLISPVEFIPLAEEMKLIIPLGYKIISNALGFINNLKNQGYEGIEVSINVSIVQLLSTDFIKNMMDLIRESGANPGNICVEVTESVFSFDFTKINRLLGELRNEGLKIAIDDFGTGYSSFAREREMDVDYLKIDKYFIDFLAGGVLEKAISSDIISMAHKQGHYVVAEGVEEERQMQYLRDHNCDKIQGYLISRPLDEDKAIEFLKGNK